MSARPIVEARDLTRHYSMGRGPFAKAATLKAVDRVSFTLTPGRTLAVVGESGCGKSTLGRLITLIENPTSGSLSIDGTDTVQDSDKSGGRAARSRFRKTVQMVFQDPYGSLNPRKKVRSILEEPLIINTRQTAGERQAAGLEMLARVGLRSEHYNRYPHMFSGGQRQRIAIARALMLRPKVVVADEPVSALDVSIQAQVLNLLMDLKDEFDLAYLFISHDLGVVRHIADEVLVMYLGRTVEQGPKDRIFQNPRHPYTQALLASTPHVDPKARTTRLPLKGELPSPLDPPAGCAFHTRCPFATDICAAEWPDLRTITDHLVACHHAEKA